MFCKVPSNVWTRCPNKDYLSHDGECNPVASTINISPRTLSNSYIRNPEQRVKDFCTTCPTTLSDTFKIFIMKKRTPFTHPPSNGSSIKQFLNEYSSINFPSHSIPKSLHSTTTSWRPNPTPSVHIPPIHS